MPLGTASRRAIMAGVWTRITMIPVIVRRLATMSRTMVFEVVNDMLKGELRRFFATPVRQGRTNRFGIFKSRDVMAAVTAILCDALTPNVNQLGFGRQLEGGVGPLPVINQ